MKGSGEKRCRVVPLSSLPHALVTDNVPNVYAVVRKINAVNARSIISRLPMAMLDNLTGSTCGLTSHHAMDRR